MTMADTPVDSGPLARFDMRPRQAAPASAGRSRFVGLLKIGLPVAALTIGALVAVWPEMTRDSRTLPIVVAEPTPGEDDSLRMANPRYTGTDDSNRPYTITAETAITDRDNRRQISLLKLHADLTMEDQRWISLTATSGVYQPDNQALQLTGPIEVYSDEGYELHARSASLDMRSGTASSDEPVHGHGPLGIMRAGGFRFDRQAQTLELQGGVSVTLYPGAGQPDRSGGKG